MIKVANTDYQRDHSGMAGDPFTDIVTLSSDRCVDVGIPGSWRILGAAIPSTQQDQICRGREGQLLAHLRR
jgi:hypothetical protein